MKLEAGKFYLDAQGNKRGPMEKWSAEYWHMEGESHLWQENGNSYYNQNPQRNLIAEWTDEHAEYETGTLAELNVKPGDLVECVDTNCGFIWFKGRKYKVSDLDGEVYCNGVTRGIYNGSCTAKFRIISRASQSATPASPVRTVTRKEIVPGVYGPVSVDYATKEFCSVALVGEQRKDMYCVVGHANLSADDLTAAIETLTTIRDALNDK